MVSRAGLHDLRAAIESAFAYVDLSAVPVDEAVNVACDYLGVPHDRDRRIVRKLVLRKVIAAGSVKRSAEA